MLDVLKEIEREKAENHKFPTYSLFIKDIIVGRGYMANEAKINLNKLNELGQVRIGRTINDYYIEIIKPNEDD
jgi:hypothetical protein